MLPYFRFFSIVFLRLCRTLHCISPSSPLLLLFLFVYFIFLYSCSSPSTSPTFSFSISLLTFLLASFPTSSIPLLFTYLLFSPIPLRYLLFPSSPFRYLFSPFPTSFPTSSLHLHHPFLPIHPPSRLFSSLTSSSLSFISPFLLLPLATSPYLALSSPHAPPPSSLHSQ